MDSEVWLNAPLFAAWRQVVVVVVVAAVAAAAAVVGGPTPLPTTPFACVALGGGRGVGGGLITYRQPGTVLKSVGANLLLSA